MPTLWSRGRSKKRSASEDLEPVDEVPMDAQSPGGANEAGATENPPKDPPKAEMLSPVQKLTMYSQSVDQHKKETDNALDMIKIVCRENEEKEESNVKLSADNATLRQENHIQAEKLQHLEKEVYEMKIELESEKRNCFVLTEEKRECDRLVAEQSKDLLAHRNYIEELNERLKNLERELYERNTELESERRNCFVLTEEKRERERLVAEQREDLLANQKHIEELNKRLKEADGESKRTAMVLSRKEALELELINKNARLREAEERYKEAEEHYEVQLGISGSWTTKARALEEENAQLRLNLEVINKQLSEVFSERESLKDEVHRQRAKEEGLQLLLREKAKEISGWRHAWDAQNQHLQAAIATSNPSQSSFQPSLIGRQIAVPTPVGQAGQGVGQHARYDFRPRKTQETTGATDVFSMIPPQIPPQIPLQIPPTAFPEFQLPPTNCPRPSTIMLSLYAGRIAPKWYEVAHALGVGTEADGLMQTEHSTERKCLLCLKAWTEGDPEVECSWLTLFRVLHHFQLHAIAKDIYDELQKSATLDTLNHSI